MPELGSLCWLEDGKALYIFVYLENGTEDRVLSHATKVHARSL